MADAGTAARSLGRSLHRLRSALARVRAELDLVELDGVAASAAQEALDAALEALAEAETAVDAPATPSAVARNCEVVMFEDDHRLAQLTARRLERAGLSVRVTSTLQEALVEAGSGAVLVADLGALEPASEAERLAVRATRPILVSGGATAASRVAARQLDAHAFLLKPVSPDALVAAISARLVAGRS